MSTTHAANDAHTGERILALMRTLRAKPDGEYLQSLIAYHAAPTLSGIKPATLLCPHAGGRDLGQALRDIAPCLARSFGVKVAGFRNGAGALLLLIYRPDALGRALADAGARRLLREAGYGVDGADVDGLLSHLAGRCGGGEFPHEIGVFLGYPADDVRAFMACRGKKCSASGCWKAYGDAGRARTCFDRFRRAKLRAAELLMAEGGFESVVDGLRGAYFAA